MPPSTALDFNFSIADPLKQRRQSRLVAGLLLTAVLALHIGLAWHLVNAPKTEQPKPPVVKELALLSAPAPVATEPPAPQVKKEPEKPKSPAKKPPMPVKKPVIVKKPEPKQTDTASMMPVPRVEPAVPTATAAPSNAPAAAKPAPRPDTDNKTVVSGVVPLVRVLPTYPSRAASRGTEGWVKVEFTIKPDGTVDDAVVVKSEPEGTFDDAALAAIEQWEFKAKIVNGIAVPQRATQLLQFKLDR